MSNNKTILSQTKRITPITKGTAVEDTYTLTGENIIKNSNNSYQISSYIPETRILYSADYEDAQNQIKIDTVAAAEYIKNSSHLLVSFDLQTELPEQQQYQGNYGLIIGLDFLDNSTQQTVTHYYTVDIDNVVGNPYLMMEATTQFQLYEIDSENFQRINMIAIFSEDFPNTNLEADTDIYISNLELGGATLIEEADLDSYSLTLVTPRGYIFTDTHDPSDTRTVEAKLKVKGNEIELNTDNSFIYWFVENASINPQSEKYQQYGGQGWECLNEIHMKQPVIDEEGKEIVPEMPEFLSSSGTLTITKSEILLQRLKYKCVVVYNENVLTKEISMVNLDAEYRIRIQSDSGTVFYFDNGSPTLTCVVQHKENDEWVPVDTSNTFNYIWGVTDYTGRFQVLAETQELRQQLDQIQFLINIIQEYLDAEYLLYQRYVNFENLYPSNQVIQNIRNTTQRAQVAAIKQELLDASFTLEDINTLLENFDATPSQYTTWKMLLLGTNNYVKALPNLLSTMEMNQIIDGNKISKLNIKNIVNFSIYRCSVFFNTGNTRLGTGDITISNILAIENGYSLIINNGNQVFKYNSQGLSPTSNQNKNPLKIQELSFSLYDNLGNLIDLNAIIPSNIIWTVPTKETLLKFENYTGENQTDSTIDYKGLLTLNYTINDVYSMSKTNNIIKLQVQYKDLVLIATTSFTFTKEGALGTNGTDYICKIIPNVISGDTPENPTLYDYDTSYGFSIYLNWETALQTGIWLKAQLWHNGGNEPIFEDSESGTSTENKTVTIEKWEVLKNVYSTSYQDATNINVQYKYDSHDQATKWRFSYNRGAYAQAVNRLTSIMPANIIKLTLVYDGYTYYATLPIIICRLSSNKYRVNLEDGTGFREVLYSSSGLQPEYNNNEPFELQVVQQISEDKFEDITTKQYGNYHLIYHWYYQGSTWRRNNTGTWVSYTETTDTSTGESSKHWLMQGFRTGIEPHQKSIVPADTYDGECVNTAIACYIEQMDENSNATIPVAWIHIPIHMMRNRYANSAINSWDGNSVNLGGSNGGMILAPQVGAGIKETDNSFTGMFIGTAKDPKESVNSSSISSLVGYYDEDVGLFGYYKGSRSVFIDAKTGRATFGLSNKGQIILDPTNETAKIYGGNYNTTTGTGLLIDLTTPEIRYGSGNFIVNNNGEITAKNANVQGVIHATTLILDNKISPSDIEGLPSSFEIYIGADGKVHNASGVHETGTIDEDHPGIKVKTDGLLEASNAIIYGSLYSSQGKIAGWSITSDQIYKDVTSGSLVYRPFLAAPTNPSLTTTEAFGVRLKNNNTQTYPFRVFYNGKLQATNASIKGSITALNGYIGYTSASSLGWQITSNAICAGPVSLTDTSTGTYVGIDGILNRSGSNKVKITNGKIEASGTLKADAGSTIGEWTVNNAGIYNGLNISNGNINFNNLPSSTGIFIGPSGIASNDSNYAWKIPNSCNISFWDKQAYTFGGDNDTKAWVVVQKSVNTKGSHTNYLQSVIYPWGLQNDVYINSTSLAAVRLTTGQGSATTSWTHFIISDVISATTRKTRFSLETQANSLNTYDINIISNYSTAGVAQIELNNTKGKIGLRVAADGSRGVVDITNNSWLVYVNTSGDVILNGSVAKAIGDESGNNIKASYAASFSISDHTITLKNKNGTSLGTVTVPDNNTTYSAGTGLTLSSTTFSISKDNVSTILNLLDEASDTANAGSYLIVTGNNITNFKRKKVSDVVNAARVKAALGTGTGTTTYLRNDGSWATPANTITGVKGSAESSYRTGNVSLSAANVGALSTGGGTLTGSLTTSGQFGSGGKGSGSDKIAGGILSSGGHLYLQSANGSHIYFYYGTSTAAATSQIYESASGTLSVSANLTVAGTLTGHDYSGLSHVMVGSASDNAHRVGYLYHQNGTTVRVYGQAGGSGYTTYTTLSGTSSSDIRLKENIKDSKVNALNLINQIEITAFDWKTNWKDYKYQPIGMIADQIEKLDYRLVIGGGNDPDGEPNYKVIDDHYLACYLTKGIQELYNKIEKLESEIKTLKENK